MTIGQAGFGLAGRRPGHPGGAIRAGRQRCAARDAGAAAGQGGGAAAGVGRAHAHPAALAPLRRPVLEGTADRESARQGYRGRYFKDTWLLNFPGTNTHGKNLLFDVAGKMNEARQGFHQPTYSKGSTWRKQIFIFSLFANWFSQDKNKFLSQRCRNYMIDNRVLDFHFGDYVTKEFFETAKIPGVKMD